MNEQSKLLLEGERATEMLRGKTVSTVWRHRPGEVGIEFTDGTRLFVDHTDWRGAVDHRGKPAHPVK